VVKSPKNELVSPHTAFHFTTSFFLTINNYVYTYPTYEKRAERERQSRSARFNVAKFPSDPFKNSPLGLDFGEHNIILYI